MYQNFYEKMQMTGANANFNLFHFKWNNFD